MQPQHFLPVHGEYAFLCAHAEMARDLGMPSTHVIRNGQMLGLAEKRNNATVSQSGILGEAALHLFYNDGNKVPPPLLHLLVLLLLFSSSTLLLPAPWELEVRQQVAWTAGGGVVAELPAIARLSFVGQQNRRAGCVVLASEGRGRGLELLHLGRCSFYDKYSMRTF